jgi:hypothetical protein
MDNSALCPSEETVVELDGLDVGDAGDDSDGNHPSEPERQGDLSAAAPGSTHRQSQQSARV